MLFDPKPKSVREDLYDRERELEILHKNDDPLTLILAPRRFGKTSLLKVFLNETNKPHIFLDCRTIISVGTTKENFLKNFVQQLEKLTEIDNSLLKILKKIKGLKIFGLEISLTNEKELQLVELLEKLNDWVARHNEKLILAFDEAQLLRFLRRAWGFDFVQLFAHIYDNLDSVQIVLTGSEVGILEDLLALEDPKSPLYGRYVKEIHIPKLEPNESKDFLQKGFSQYDFEVPGEIIESAVQRLDGIIGWLVYFGKRTIDFGRVDQKILNEIVHEAKQLVLGELESLFKFSPKYRHVLKAVALDVHNWSDIKEVVETKTKTKLTDTSFNRILTKLVKMGYLEIERTKFNQYFIIDPIVKEAMKSS